MDIEELERNWDEYGKADPLWSILALAEKKGNQWSIDEFFATGQREIGAALDWVTSLGARVLRRNALDFGCGVGRLTQALADHFDRVCGVDMAPSMIELANRYNRHPSRCKYYLNQRTDLKLFPGNTFDFVYAGLTLQHMQPRYFKNYLREFLAVLLPGGIAVFDLPSEHANKLLARVLRVVPSVLANACRNLVLDAKHGSSPIMEMHWMKQEHVVRFVEQHGGSVLDLRQQSGAAPNWVVFQYCMTKASHGGRSEAHSL